MTEETRTDIASVSGKFWDLRPGAVPKMSVILTEVETGGMVYLQTEIRVERGDDVECSLVLSVEHLEQLRDYVTFILGRTPGKR
jgi:hypothetical protein